ncbi:MAG: hypothetical protein ACEPOV_13350 [Hyphomicrobiales bacterium]
MKKNALLLIVLVLSIGFSCQKKTKINNTTETEAFSRKKMFTKNFSIEYSVDNEINVLSGMDPEEGLNWVKTINGEEFRVGEVALSLDDIFPIKVHRKSADKISFESNGRTFTICDIEFADRHTSLILTGEDNRTTHFDLENLRREIVYLEQNSIKGKPLIINKPKAPDEYLAVKSNLGALVLIAYIIDVQCDKKVYRDIMRCVGLGKKYKVGLCWATCID